MVRGFHSLNFIKEIAQTADGGVHVVQYEEYDQLFVAKLLRAPFTSCLGNQKYWNDPVENELKTFERINKIGINHENIIRMEEIIYLKDKETYCLLLEYCHGGDLYEKLVSSSDQRFSQDMSRFFFQQIVSGTDYLHKIVKTAHLDLSLENVFLTKENRCRLGDFGFCFPIENNNDNMFAKRSMGKHFYAAPELYSIKPCYDPVKADVWSLGIILFMMLMGQPPVTEASSRDENYQIILNYGIKKLIHLLEPNDEFLLSSEVLDLLSLMLEPSPNKRATTDDILKHPWLVKNKIDDPSQ